MDESRGRGKRQLLLLAAMFLLPVIAAFVLYYGNIWRPSGTSNKGELITPPRPLDANGLLNPDGSAARSDALRGKWSLIYIGDGGCDEACRTALVFGRQSRLALNNDMTRVQRVLLSTGNCCANDYLEREQPGMVTLDASAAQALLAQFPGDQARSLYIVDPLGNLMMRHDATSIRKDLLSDLKRLLKLSHIG